ncbi:glutathione S-transferase [Coccomyxa subellipsoidea C-169]|uniref:Glutathione S-transferase n=1 Tax=Coccomyxa subellipsoidea (strain C-169) TaxID=574566 RepID=I0Z7F7_COCSC|nr:glutathione S-transferase [Coccomyxa subellipsoidea C-169]EIE26576.1 glutathione S-transferase [Coccomyxa subellipsoidea C-169]|eukprot:XP_005651120.1 glutathione S-transferase [Coccomyxa subellipsoidea C-169]
MADAGPRKSYTLLTAGTPNGWKPSITLEELGSSYDVKKISLSDNEQKQDWFLKINPNGRIPALVDHTCGDLPIFESGAIMWWLASRDPEGKLFPKDPSKQAEVMSWLMFQMGGLGPMQGQANHFLRYAPVKIEYGINRYVNETNRLYQVLDDHLKDHEWLAADQYTIADIANFTWVFIHTWSGVSLDDKPHLKAWFEKIEARPAVQRGLDIPEANKFKSMTEEEAQKAVEEVQKFMGSTAAPATQK